MLKGHTNINMPYYRPPKLAALGNLLLPFFSFFVFFFSPFCFCFFLKTGFLGVIALTVLELSL